MGRLRRKLHFLQNNAKPCRAETDRKTPLPHDLRTNRQVVHRAEFADSCKLTRVTAYFHDACIHSGKGVSGQKAHMCSHIQKNTTSPRKERIMSQAKPNGSSSSGGAWCCATVTIAARPAPSFRYASVAADDRRTEKRFGGRYWATCNTRKEYD